MSATEASWLTMAVQGGFVVGTLLAAFVNLADLVKGRRLVCAGAVAAPSPTPPCSSRPARGRRSVFASSPESRSPPSIPRR